MRTNVSTPTETVHTHGGAQAVTVTPTLTLRRQTLAAMLWEDQYYQSGSSHAADVADTVRALVADGKADVVAATAIEARERMYLRHMPLYLLALLTQYKGCGTLVAKTLPRVCLRADEPGEFVAIYAKLFPGALRAKVNYKTGQPIGIRQGIKLSAGVKRGLAVAMKGFSPYALAKYNKDNAAVGLADVLRYVHPKPHNDYQSGVWRQLVKGELAPPDTWEVALSAGDDKRDAFERLLREDKLGGLAFLRNLRNMVDAGVDKDLIRARFDGEFNRVLPFRFITAAKHAPTWETDIDRAMLRAAGDLPKLAGHTVLVIDVSGSMGSPIGGKSELSRMDAAAALTMLAREQCEYVTVVCTAGSDARQVHATEVVPARRGMALRDLIADAKAKLGGGGIFLVQCMEWIRVHVADTAPVDRVVVFTDEQDCDHSKKPDTAERLGTRGNYMVNVAAYEHGIGYKPWVHVDGFSERVLDFVREVETNLQ